MFGKPGSSTWHRNRSKGLLEGSTLREMLGHTPGAGGTGIPGRVACGRAKGPSMSC